jgi:hypothetical protein
MTSSGFLPTDRLASRYRWRSLKQPEREHFVRTHVAARLAHLNDGSACPGLGKRTNYLLPNPGNSGGLTAKHEAGEAAQLWSVPCQMWNHGPPVRSLK